MGAGVKNLQDDWINLTGLLVRSILRQMVDRTTGDSWQNLEDQEKAFFMWSDDSVLEVSWEAAGS